MSPNLLRRLVRFLGLVSILTGIWISPPVFSRIGAVFPNSSGETICLWLICLALLSFGGWAWSNSRAHQKSGLLLLFFLFVAVDAELFARLYVRRLHPSSLSAALESALIAYPKLWMLKPHPFLQYTGNSKFVRDPDMMNETGFKGPILPLEKTPGTIRIVALGGSTTANGFPAMMEKYMRQQRPGASIEVMNFGLPGYSSTHDVVNFVLNAIDYDPDYVIFHQGWNDFHARDAEHTFRGDYGHAYKSFKPPQPIDLPLIRLSVIYRSLKAWIHPLLPLGYFRQAILHARKTPHRYDNLNDLRVFKRNIRTIIDVAAGRGIKPVLTTQPHSTDPAAAGASEAVHMDQCNAATREVLDENRHRVLFVDLDKAFTGKKNELFTDLGHLTEEGMRQEAVMMADEILADLDRNKTKSFSTRVSWN